MIKFNNVPYCKVSEKVNHIICIIIAELVDNLLVNIDKTSAGIESETKEVVNILKKDSTRGIYLIIIIHCIQI